MLVIRFSRVGRHNHAQYRIVVQEKTKAPTGKHVDIVGSYDPHSKQTVLKEEKIKIYLENGAQPSDSVYNLLVRNGLIKGEKRAVKLPEKKIEEAPADTEVKDDTEQKDEKPAETNDANKKVDKEESVKEEKEVKAADKKEEKKEDVKEIKSEEKKAEKKAEEKK